MSNDKKTIGLASDHAGFLLKQYVKEYLAARGYESEDYGCFNEDSCDYPDFAHKLGGAIDNGSIDTGIAICGTGQGMAISLNKHSNVRAEYPGDPQGKISHQRGRPSPDGGRDDARPQKAVLRRAPPGRRH